VTCKDYSVSAEPRDIDVGRYCYEAFLTFDIWKDTARRVRIRADHKCERCGYRDDPNFLVVHHADTRYSNPNRPDAPWWVPKGWLPDDCFLVCLCGDCHAYVHGHGSDPLAPEDEG